jgi:hypothetical protein
MHQGLSAFGKDYAETGLASLASLSLGAQAIAVAAGEYTKKSFEAGGKTIEKLVSAGSLEKGKRDPVRLCQAGL